MKNFLITATGSLLLLAVNTQADQVILDDLIIDGSICSGMDCVNGESFGFDTLRLKENNLRIKAQDTSSTSSFPSNDWQITFNDSANGGQNKFSIDDIDGGRTPFTLEAGAPNNSLYVDDGGKLGLGTSTPVVNLHVVSGNSPTLRLEQNGSSGFTPQAWDLAGNEANFFIRDVTNGSTLPFRIRPGAPSSSIDIASDGDVGIGTDSPDAGLHILDPENDTPLHVEGTGVVLVKLESNDNGAVQLRLKSNSTNRRLLAISSSDVVESQAIFGNGEVKFAGASDSTDLFATLNSTGLVVEGGSITVNGAEVHNIPDYVFDKNYELMPLSTLKYYINKNKHLPEIPSAEDVANNGINMTEMQVSLLKKVEELTLYTLAQQETIEELKMQLTKLAEDR